MIAHLVRLKVQLLANMFRRSLWRVVGIPRLAYRTSGVYADGWTGRMATIDRFACSGRTTVRLRQGRLFAAPQIVILNGMWFRVRKARAVTLPTCHVSVFVPETRIPGGGDDRQLGIIVDGFS